MPVFPQFVAKPLVSTAQWFFKYFGFELRDVHTEADIPDAEYYWPMYSPWLTPAWRQILRIEDEHSLLSPQARYTLNRLAKYALSACTGEVAECGVYKGGAAKLLAEATQRPLYLFDTFEGMPETDPSKDRHRKGDFSDTSLDAVRSYLREHSNVVFVPGLIPDSLEVAASKEFSFVHIDLDIYSAIIESCKFFYPRLKQGGVLLFDDYGFPSCPGARQAIEEFFSDKPETIVALYTGQCFVIKTSESTCVDRG